jgi:hypothetical protein
MPRVHPAAKFGLLSLVVAGLAATAVAASGGFTRAPRLVKEGPVYQLEVGDEAYHFDALWRIETLWRNGPDGWTRVASPDHDHLSALRAAFLSQAKAATLQDIPVEGRENLRALKTLGYL